MKLSDIIEDLAEDMPNIERKDIQIIVNEIINCMIDGFKDGQDAQIRGFGTFKVKTVEPKLVRDPRNGQRVFMGRKSAVKFKAGGDLLSRINKKAS